ncbi:glycosyltransferase family 2 protein [Acrocarpospora catenulata]|uniref:glycosyltransferase family 2 protein n=1 Tax=Acrocarpospora catenulata TaxID=2836182 RepID=UPI001BDA5704|nr:glycosyltransferase family 2 protein [Acrocarpospora catenulata]
MGVKVSVVVSVADPGPADDSFDACVRSVLDLPPDEYEVIFADDQSTDGAAERLDAVAAVRDNIRVLHLERSGSPLPGRNLALSTARGAYVFFMNAHDRLEPGALAKMYDKAMETDADVLVGRLAWGGPPLAVFARSRDRADLLRDRLLTVPTAHKLFRRDFLDDRQLRFGELPLAEYAFVLRAYLAAKVVAILAEPVCCHVAWVEEDPDDPRALVSGLRELMDIVDIRTEPGQQRDRVHAYLFRVLGLRRLGGQRYLAASGEHRNATFTLLRELAVERFPERLDRYLPVHLRARSALLRAGRAAELNELAQESRGTTLRAELRDVRWDSSVLTLSLAVEIVRADGTPLTFRYDDGRLYWIPPINLDGLLPPVMTEVTEAAEIARMEVYIRNPDTGVSYFLPVTSEVDQKIDDNRARLRAVGVARLDVGTAALGHPVDPGVWEVHVRMRGAHPARTRVGRPPSGLNVAGVLAEFPRRLVVPCWSEQGELSVCVEPRSFPESIALVSTGVSVARRDGHVYVALPVPYVPPSGGPAVELLLRKKGPRGRTVAVPALVEPGVPGKLAGQLVAKVQFRRISGEGTLGPGDWWPRLRMEDKVVDLRFGLEIGRGGQVRLIPVLRRRSWVRRVFLRIFRGRNSPSRWR